MPKAPQTFVAPWLAGRAASRREYDAKRRIEKPWRKWYFTATWRAIRIAQLTSQPLCQRCATRGEVVEATVCNHRAPHRGDWATFIAGPFESLCKRCHDGEVQREERAASVRGEGGSKV